MLIKKSGKQVKGKGGIEQLNDYLENAEINICKINKI